MLLGALSEVAPTNPDAAVMLVRAAAGLVRGVCCWVPPAAEGGKEESYRKVSCKVSLVAATAIGLSGCTVSDSGASGGAAVRIMTVQSTFNRAGRPDRQFGRQGTAPR